MAACDDLQNHVPHNRMPPGVLAHAGSCGGNVHACKFRHRGHPNGFEVCQACLLHTRLILGLAIPQAAGGVLNLPHNHPRTWELLPEWFNHNLATALPQGTQWAVAPFVANHGPVPMGVRTWQSPGEYNTGVLTAPPRSNPPFKQFLTRVCNDCEEYIQNEIYFRAQNIISTSDMERATCQQLPWNTCTCKTTLGMPRMPIVQQGVNQRLEVMCRTHREEVFARLMEKRNRNDRWLRNIAVKNGSLVQASAQTLRNRVNRPGYWRACRCGKEINHGLAPPECFICMACEGYVSRTGNYTMHNNAQLVTPWTAMPTIPIADFRKIRTGKFKLNRAPHVG